MRPMQMITEHPRLDWHLDNWARYMRNTGAKFLDCTTTRYWTGNNDFDLMADRMEHTCARTVDALVLDLPSPQRRSMWCMHLGTRWDTLQGALDQLYPQARASLSAALLRRGMS